MFMWYKNTAHFILFYKENLFIFENFFYTIWQWIKLINGWNINHEIRIGRRGVSPKCFFRITTFLSHLGTVEYVVCFGIQHTSFSSDSIHYSHFMFLLLNLTLGSISIFAKKQYFQQKFVCRWSVIWCRTLLFIQIVESHKKIAIKMKICEMLVNPIY